MSEEEKRGDAMPALSAVEIRPVFTGNCLNRRTIRTAMNDKDLQLAGMVGACIFGALAGIIVAQLIVKFLL